VNQPEVLYGVFLLASPSETNKLFSDYAEAKHYAAVLGRRGPIKMVTYDLYRDPMAREPSNPVSPLGDGYYKVRSNVQ
jgi:hypothetical protein